MVHIFVIMGMAVSQRLVVVLMGMGCLFMTMFVMVVFLVPVAVFHRVMLVRILFHHSSF